MAKVTNKETDDIFWNMPLRMVFAYEHMYYVSEGFICTPTKNELDGLLKGI